MKVGTGTSPRRRATLLVSSVLVLLPAVVNAPAALAQTTCDRTEADGYSTLTVNMDADQTIAVRFFGSTVDISDGVNAEATDFVPQQDGLDADCVVEADVERMLVNGSTGGETLKVIEWGTSEGETTGSEIQTTVDFGAGNDTLEFMSADTNNNGVTDPTPRIGLALGTAAEGGGIVADQGPTTEGNFLTDCVDSFNGAGTNTNGIGFDCSDLWALNAEKIVVTGGSVTGDGDAIDAQGDFDGGFVDSGTTGFFEPDDPQIPGTLDHEGLDSDGGLDNNDNEPNGGGVELPLVANLNAGRDFITPGEGDDTIDGGAGQDLVDYAEAGAGIKADLTAGEAAGGSGGDILNSVQGAVGSAFDDELRGSKGRDILGGYCGDDLIGGRGGSDALFGDFESFLGGPVCDQSSGGEEDPAAPTPDFASGGDKIIGGGGRDFVKGMKGNDKLSGGKGKDGLNGGGGTDKGNGGPGRDRCRKIENKTSCEK
jgi:hypothetical protein